MATTSGSFGAIEALLASRRLGEPVFVRCLLLARESVGDPLVQLANLAGIICGWFGVPPLRLHAVGAASQGQIAVTLQFQNGALALVLFACCPEGAGGLDWLILGNDGAAFQEAAVSETGEGFSIPGPQGSYPNLLSAIQRSLERGQPELLAGSRHQ